MTTEEKKLILNLSLNLITKDAFFSQYPEDLIANKDYVLDELKKAYTEKNADDVEYSLLLGFLLKTFSNKYEEILCKLLSESWHYKHEDIVLILQDLKSAKCIDVLYETVFKKFNYLSYDNTYSLARKCIHALGDINTDYSKEKLKLLAMSDIPIIKEKAEKQLYYYKR